jgi:hypothetical protein
MRFGESGGNHEYLLCLSIENVRRVANNLQIPRQLL